ncbi:DUF4129 domain-containing protein [Nocardioides panaciterrulae]|uniref:Protein-glutamine gamma-glutamyltransferase-like C-terminal domain-containing protein n=1 Tax=Nocardioides panaciterrulae TaxID=661492 RepID=A0A7Y9J9U5_9ACTN|nr:DUF4129 domain-containing protein [Nocardioides panaciterrulae]NYD41002.1 hypothetical protein [Nocardioides panaciterrulae]
MGARRASVTAVAAVAGTVLLVSLLVTWAASIGPDAVLRGAGPATHRASVTPTRTATPSGTPTAARSSRPPQQRPAGHHPVVGALLGVLLVVVVVALAGLLMLVLRRLWEAWTLRRRPPPEPEQADFDAIETPRRLAAEMVRDAARQRELLEEGDPRNAIVAAWHRFEEQAAEAGLRRRPWETSAEFTLRVLDLVDADSAQVARLAALFREARFSEHALGEPARAEALAALDAVHAGLQAVAGARR